MKSERTLAGLTEEVDHPLYGSLVMWAPVVDLSHTPGELRQACLRGQHNRSILRELGFDEAAIDALEHAGVISPPTLRP